MAKKRRDKERDSSTVGKVAKVGAAALSVGVTAASFAKKGYTKKLTSEIVPTVIGASKTINNDLRKARASRSGLNKGIKMQDTYDTYQNHLKGHKLLKSEYSKAKVNSRKNIKIKTDDKRKSLFGQIKNTIQTEYNDLDRGLKEALRSEYELKYLKDKVIPKYKDKDAAFLKQVTENAFAVIEENTTVDKKGKRGFSSFMDKHFKEGKFTAEQKNEFLNNIYEQKEKIDKIVNNKEYIANAKAKVAQEIKKKAFESKKKQDTLFGKASNAINKLTGIDIDLEEILTGSKAMTVGDFIKLSDENPDLFDSSSFENIIKNNSGNKWHKYDTKNIKDIVKEYAEKDEGFKDVILDRSLRISKDGEVFNTYDFDDMLSNAYRKFSSSLPGSLFGQTDHRLSNEAPIIAVMKAGSRSVAAGYEIGNETQVLRSSKIAIGNSRTGSGSLFNLKLDENTGDLIMDLEALEEEGFIRNIKHGKRSRLHRNTLGTGRTVFNNSEDTILQLLDINQSGAPSTLEKLKARFTKGSDPDWIKNVINRSKSLVTDDMTIEQRINQTALDKVVPMMTSDGEANARMLEDAKAEVAARLFKDTKEVSALLNNYTAMHQIDDDTIQVLLDASNNGLIKDNHSKKILHALVNDDLSNMELLQSMSTAGGSLNFEKLYNKDLENIINRELVNTDHIMHMQNISQLKPAGFLPESTNVMEIRDIIKREAIKEVLIRESAVGMDNNGKAMFKAQGIEHLEDILRLDTLTKEQSNNLRYVANWGIMQSSLELYNDTDATYRLSNIIGENGTLSNFEQLIKSNPSFKTEYKFMLDDLSSKYNIFDEGTIGNINEIYANEFNSFEFNKKSSLHIDNLAKISSINDLIKTLGQAKDEILAGRHDLRNYTTLTQIPQFMVSRLAWGVEEMGLGFSAKSTGSTLDVIKNIGLRRVLPIAAAFSLYDYLDYESENFTGISMTGAAANTLSNFDIASRKLAYSTGIGQAIDWFKESSVIGEY